MKRLWTALLTSVLAAAAIRAQAPTPRPVTPTPYPGSSTAPAAPAAPVAPSGPIVIPPTMPLPGDTPAVPTPLGVPAIVEQPGASCLGCGNLGHRDGSACATCGCETCGPIGRVWGSVDLIFLSGKGDTPPPLVTTSPAGTPLANAGVLGLPTTSIIAGNQPLNDDFRAGVKLEAGAWINSAQTLGVQLGAFKLADGNDGNFFASDGTTILARPFVRTDTNAQSSQLIAINDPAAGAAFFGSIEVREITKVEGFDAALRGNVCCASCWRLDALIGYRYLRLADQLRITQNVNAGPASVIVPPGASITSTDVFETQNVFNGAEVGLTGEYRRGRWILDGTLKASYGYLAIQDRISGGTVTTVGGASVSSNGGLLALSSNIGQRDHNEGDLVPEINVNLGYQLTDRIRVRVGYDFLYFDDVFRAGQRIDTFINPDLVPNNPPAGNTTSRPTPQRTNTDFYLQGVNLGFEVRF